MKIVFLTRLFRPHVGGVEKHTEKLSQALIGQGHSITVVTSQYDTKLPLFETTDSVRIIRIPKNKLDSKSKLWLWMLEHQGLFANADIIHAHDVFWWYLPIKFMHPAKPIYTTFHGYEGSGPPRLGAILHRKAAESLSWGSICIGAFMKGWYHANPDFVSYGATNFSPQTLKAKPNTAIFVGRLSADTGILNYLEGLKILKDKHRSINLDIYGDGPQLKQAKAYAFKHKLKAKFLGFTPDAAAKISNYQYAFISRYLGILEAMVDNRLVFANYNNQIKKDYLTCHPQASNMIIFHSGDELAQAILDFDPKVTAQKLQQAFTWAKNQTWDHLAQVHLKLWQKD